MKETNYHRDFLYFVPYFLGEREEEGVQWSTLTLNKKKPVLQQSFNQMDAMVCLTDMKVS